MTRTALSSTIAALALAGSAQAQAPAAPPPTLAYAFSARVEVAAPIEQGEIDGGRKRFVPIIGGAIAGPRLTGTVLPGGGDWQTIFPGGLTRVEARYFLKAADGAVIGIHNEGVRVATPDITEKLAKGERVDPGRYYFRTSTRFDPPPGPHAWLRGKTFVGRGVRMPDHVIIDFYTVE